MNTAQSFRSAQERKLNGPNGFKVSTLVKDGKLVFRSYWRVATDHAPGHCLKVTYHA